MAAHAGPTGHHGNGIVIAVAAAVAVLVAVVLVMSASTQSSLQQGRATGTQQRLDQEQVTCALWAVLGSASASRARASQTVAAAADRICAEAPTPVATSTP